MYPYIHLTHAEVDRHLIIKGKNEYNINKIIQVNNYK